jgi:hypothetical protein
MWAIFIFFFKILLGRSPADYHFGALKHGGGNRTECWRMKEQRQRDVQTD